MTLQNRYAPLSVHSLPLPGTYPHIVKHLPKIGGLDNMGPGNTQHGESFLLKKGGLIGASEFIGAGLCAVCGIPYCSPSIVTIDHLGGMKHVFAVDSETGALVWQVPQVDPNNTVNTTPVLCGERLLLTNSSRGYGAVFGVQLGDDSRHEHGPTSCRSVMAGWSA